MSGRTCIVDVGTGRTKIGFCGSEIPEFNIPSCVGLEPSYNKKGVKSENVLRDLNYLTGDQMIENKTCEVASPMKGGIIHDYTLYEKLMGNVIYKHLSVDPSEHNFFMTEPPLNPPENREFLAELMFETFSSKGIYIGMQAVMALVASWVGRAANDRPTTGIVMDSGHGLTHIIPVVQCYAIGTSIRFLPIAGSDINLFIQQLVRERETELPKENMNNIAIDIKEQHCYVCKDIRQEFAKMETDPEKVIKKYEHIDPRTKKSYSFDMSYERFLGPELFFRPNIYNSEFTKSVSDMIYDSVLNCAVDCRRGLLKNIVLSGGSTVFPNLGRRVEKDVNTCVQANTNGTNPMEAKVTSHSRQLYAVYFGSSMLANMPAFESAVHTRSDYAENGASICRHNPIFGVLT